MIYSIQTIVFCLSRFKVAFRNLYLVNGGEGLLGMAARTHPDYLGKGYFGKLHEGSFLRTLTKHPHVKYMTFASQYTARYKNPSDTYGRQIKAIYVSDILHHQNSMYSVSNIIVVEKNASCHHYLGAYIF